MIYIFTSLRAELAPIIDLFNLDSDGDVYINDQIIACVTGVGKINAAFSVGKVFTLYKPTADSVMINVGVCAGNIPGEIFHINSITDDDTARNYYPDMIYNLGLREGKLTTVSQVVSKVSDDDLFDMEASAIYSCVSKYISPDRMFYIKIVSDSGVNEGDRIKPEDISKNIEKAFPAIEKIVSIFEESNNEISDENDIDKYADVLYCSEYMRNELSGLITFAKTINVDYDLILKNIMAGYEEINSRKIGREVLDEFKKRITS